MKILANGALGVLLFFALPGFAAVGLVFLLILGGPDSMKVITDDPTMLRATGFLHWAFIGIMTLGGVVVALKLANRLNNHE